MNTQELINQIERKDMIIKSLQKQIQDNLHYFKQDSLYDVIENLKNELKRKDTEINFLETKLQTLKQENSKYGTEYCDIKQDYLTLKSKYDTEIERLNSIIKNNSFEKQNYLQTIDKLKASLNKAASDNSNILLSNENMNMKLNNFQKDFDDYENCNNILKNEVNIWRTKYNASEMELKETKNKFNNIQNDLKFINEKLRTITQENCDIKNYLNRILNDLTYWIRDNDFLLVKFPKTIYDNSNVNGINFSAFYDSIILLQEKVNNILNMHKKEITSDQENIIQDNVNLIKDNIALKNQLNIKENTIQMMLRELNNKV